MDNLIMPETLEGHARSVTFDTVPDECPICHISVLPKRISSAFDAAGHLQIVFQCTKRGCENLFIGIYHLITAADEAGPDYYGLREVAPRTAAKEDFKDLIRDLSPMFVEIYNQSLAAEAMNLTQITGMGLRKALEFLVKDFAIRRNPEQEAKIREAFLSQCIRNYLQDPNVSECAKRAAWLGNDETHYTRKWVDKDISDLKLLIRLTVNWIEMVLLTERYIEDMA